MLYFSTEKKKNQYNNVICFRDASRVSKRFKSCDLGKQKILGESKKWVKKESIAQSVV